MRKINNLNDLIKKHYWIGEIEIDKLSSVKWDNIEEQKDKYTYLNADYWVDEFLKKLKKYKQCEFEDINWNNKKEFYKISYENDIVVSESSSDFIRRYNKNNKAKLLVMLMYYGNCYRGYSAPWEIEEQYPTVTREEFYKIEKFMGELKWNI